ncbi:MAG: hypothetical protein O3A48_03550 [Actinomycetota bacterium]|nr:hypothetical protein [Actinomycetota bacterium]MDA3013596.1 hypothetical protein [Actinomycetota bacterium]
MRDILEKLLGYLKYHSFIKEAYIQDDKLYFKVNYIFEDVQIFLNRFEYLSIKFENDIFYIDNEDLNLLSAAGELEKYLVAY